jgi:acyl-CoA thioesterase FadM
VNSPSSSVYHHPCFIPFHLSDAAGILFFGHVFTLTHEAFEYFVRKVIHFTWADWFQNSEWIVPIKHAEANYLHPLYAGSECLIELSIIEISNSTFTLNASFVQQQTTCCMVKTIHVFCSRTLKKKIPIPASILARLAHLMG